VVMGGSLVYEYIIGHPDGVSGCHVTLRQLVRQGSPRSDRWLQHRQRECCRTRHRRSCNEPNRTARQ